MAQSVIRRRSNSSALCYKTGPVSFDWIADHPVSKKTSHFWVRVNEIVPDKIATAMRSLETKS